MEKLKRGAGDAAGSNITIFKAKGCQECHETGYKGRRGLYEIFRMNSKLRELTVDPKTALEEIREIARAQGMRTLFEEGAATVLGGTTTIEEMMRVCTLEE